MPTRLGWTVTLAGCAVLVCGSLLGFRQLVIVGCAAVTAQLAALASVAWRPPVHLKRDVSPIRVARGDPAVCVLTVSAPSRWPVPATTAIDGVGRQRTAVPVPPLRPRSSRTITYRLDTERRGVFQVGPLHHRREDLFGLAERTRAYTAPATLLVYPRLHLFTMPPAGRSRHLDGLLADTALARSTTFHRLRDYVPGDDLRHVHWRSTARTGRLMVREYIDTSLPGTTVLLDATLGPEPFEEAVEVAASALMAAVRNGFPARLVYAGATVEGRDESVLLDRLAEVEPAGSAGLAELADALPATPLGGTLFAVTGSLAGLPSLRRLTPLFDHTVLFVLADAQAYPTTADGVTILTAPDAGRACAAWNAQTPASLQGEHVASLAESAAAVPVGRWR